MKNSILLTSGPTTNRVTAHSVVRRWDEGRAKSLPSFSGLHHFFVLRFAFSIIHGRGRAQTTTTKKWLYYTECKPKRKKKMSEAWEREARNWTSRHLACCFTSLLCASRYQTCYWWACSYSSPPAVMYIGYHTGGTLCSCDFCHLLPSPCPHHRCHRLRR